MIYSTPLSPNTGAYNGRTIDIPSAVEATRLAPTHTLSYTYTLANSNPTLAPLRRRYAISQYLPGGKALSEAVSSLNDVSKGRIGFAVLRRTC